MRRSVFNRWFGLLLFIAALAMAGPGQAREAFLVTYGPGHEVWELFGHNAIWIRDAERGLDHTFSFGYFELDRPGFHRDFARGIMPYFGSASPSQSEFDFYRSRGRSIRVQQLALDDQQIARLYDRLHTSIFPQPQYYDYDYFWANCSTRLRDLLDEMTDGALRRALNDQPAERNFRDHTRAMTSHRYWLHTGIMTLLGPEADQSITVWDELFMPRRLAEALVGLSVDGQPLVIADELRLQSELDQQRGQSVSTALRSTLLGAGSLVLILLLMRPGRPRLARAIRLASTLAVGLAGSIIILMWLASGHEATWKNAMALVLNPLWLLMPLLASGLVPQDSAPNSAPSSVRYLWWLLLIALLAGAGYLAAPWGQFRADQLLFFVPLAAALLVAWRPERSSNRSR